MRIESFMNLRKCNKRLKARCAEGFGVEREGGYNNTPPRIPILLHWLESLLSVWVQSIFRSGIHRAYSPSSDQPHGRRPGRKLHADSARRARGAGAGRQPDGDVGTGADGVSAARPADEPRLCAAS